MPGEETRESRRPQEPGEESPGPREEDEPTRDVELTRAFQDSVREGVVRLDRSLSGLLSTGLIGGLDVSLGILALLVIEHATGMRELGALGFTIGFIALTLGRSELFTENFFVPVAAVVARKARLLSLARLWAGTLVTNLLGGWVFAWLIIAGVPRLSETAVQTASYYPEMGIGWQSFALGILAGVAITVMTWMERSSASEVGRLVSTFVIAFLLAATPLNHVIVISLEIFAALHAGAPFGYADWAASAAWAGLANMVGGLTLVTLLRLAQVGAQGIREEQARPADAGAEGNRE